MGAPPVLGSPVTAGNRVAVAVSALALIARAAVAVSVLALLVKVDVAVDPLAKVAVAFDPLVRVAVAAGAAAQLGPEIELLIRVTLPVSARALPFKLAALPNVMLVPAMIVPTNAPPVIAALVVTCQNTLQAAAPLVKLTDPLAVRLDETRKI
jgi:hypothetical protein